MGIVVAETDWSIAQEFDKREFLFYVNQVHQLQKVYTQILLLLYTKFSLFISYNPLFNRSMRVRQYGSLSIVHMYMYL